MRGRLTLSSVIIILTYAIIELTVFIKKKKMQKKEEDMNAIKFSKERLLNDSLAIKSSLIMSAIFTIGAIATLAVFTYVMPPLPLLDPDLITGR